MLCDRVYKCSNVNVSGLCIRMIDVRVNEDGLCLDMKRYKVEFCVRVIDVGLLVVRECECFLML